MHLNKWQNRNKPFEIFKTRSNFAIVFKTGRSSVRLEYTSGGRVVASSNLVTPTSNKNAANL